MEIKKLEENQEKLTGSNLNIKAKFNQNGETFQELMEELLTSSIAKHYDQ